MAGYPASATRAATPAAQSHRLEQLDIAAARERVVRSFAADGPLARGLPGFAPRPSQRDFALAVFDAIVERGTLVAEAGTGTGKTFAYLVPALLAGGKLLVSTGTKALQDQVFTKDLGILLRTLGLPLQVALLKGRQNYLCLQRLARAELEGAFTSRQEAGYLRQVVRFARVTRTGDRAELAEVPENAGIWPQVTSTRENCLGSECPRYAECFVYKARREAQAADVVVVNHHLFLSDLALRDDAAREFLPAADTVVLDEAHQLPKIASDFFGTGWSLAQVLDLAGDARSLGLRKAGDAAAWSDLTRMLEQAARDVRLVLADARMTAGSKLALDALATPGALRHAWEALDARLDAVEAALRSALGRDPELDLLGPRVVMLRNAVASWLDAAARIERRDPESDLDDATAADASDDHPVHWIAATAQGAQFHATPLAPGATFARLRAQQPQAWILTSATLTVAGRFEAFLAEIGLPEARALRWDSPFDFARQGLLYLPRTMPSPLAPDFPEQVADAAWPQIEAAGGRTFVLCSTLRAVDRVAARLRDAMEAADADFPLLVQGTSTRRAMLEAFRRAGNAVLVGSISFWEGIDVRGEALSLVVIDKLPFAPPDDPLVAARVRRLKRLGRNAFVEYQLPQAVTLLKQGVGRLIRDDRDRGVLMILDDRLLTKSYGRIVLDSLPPFARTRDAAAASEFLATLTRPT
ncbi:MAG TPA: ATP-dependent DNA helicase [Burkholderiaceae bacterium]|nr:ATP-dependent DNA helicase [Burkholderiaceae bacterium]